MFNQKTIEINNKMQEEIFDSYILILITFD